MGFFSKLFGKNEPEQTQSIDTVAQPAAAQISIDTAKVISLLGGKDNIANIKTTAYTRVRVELKTAVADIAPSLSETGFDGYMMINGKVFHLLAGLHADAACDALKAKLV